MAMHDTALFRSIARICEERGELQKALEYYDIAIECYPAIPEGMELLRRDFEGLKRKRGDVRTFHRGEAGET